MKNNLFAFGALLLLLFASGCQKGLVKDVVTDLPVLHDAGLENLLYNINLFSPHVIDLKDVEKNKDWGDIQCGKDEKKLIVKVNCDDRELYITKITLVYGSKDHVSKCLTHTPEWSPCAGPVKYDYQECYDPGKTRKEVVEIEDCFRAESCICVAVYVELKKKDGSGVCTYGYSKDSEKCGDSEYKRFFNFCFKKDDDHHDDYDKCERLRTQTPGGWGAKPAGYNPGTYLYEHFKKAFPYGVFVGCEYGGYVKLTCPEAVTKLLPTGGKAGVLYKKYTDPYEIKNVLVGHLVALTLSVGFDKYDDGFGKGKKKLCDLYIVKGKFKCWTVSGFLEEANKVLGGCSNKYSIEDVLETATRINENYVDGKTDNGFLVCKSPCYND